MVRWKALALIAALAGSTGSAAAGELMLTSPSLLGRQMLPNAQVLNGFGCSGGNLSPALAWHGLPDGTKSLAITAFDPDAPTGSGWWHWVVFNIPPSVTELPEGAGLEGGSELPEGAIQSRNDFGMPAYSGPCPPPGDPAHRYVFTLWALKADALPLDRNASGAMVGFFLNQNVIERADFSAAYRR